MSCHRLCNVTRKKVKQAFTGQIGVYHFHARTGNIESRLSGYLIEPGDMAYEQVRRVWNGMIDRHPTAIACCTTVTDVVRCIEFARMANMTVAVRGGEHNIAGNAVCDDGLVIDLSLMMQVVVETQQMRARTGGGVLWGEFDEATQQYGLATTGGLMSTTGIKGFTLGGGLGYLMRSYGLACDNLLSAGVVTADGRELTVSATEHNDLFWALRGGSGNFGVVTSMEFQLYPVGPTLLAGGLAYQISEARDMLRFYREFTVRSDDALIVYATLGYGPDGSPRVGMRAVFNGSVAGGEKAVRDLCSFGRPVADEIVPRPYLEIQRLVNPSFPPGRLNYWKAHFLTDLSDEVIDMVIEAFSRVPSRYSAIAFEQMGGAVARVGVSDTAFSHRSAAYSFLILSGWENPSQSEVNVAWARELWDQVRPLAAAGVYVNYLGSEGVQRVREDYGPNPERLTEIKRKYDPDNFFHMNQNIRPSGASSS